MPSVCGFVPSGHTIFACSPRSWPSPKICTRAFAVAVGSMGSTFSIRPSPTRASKSALNFSVLPIHERVVRRMRYHERCLHGLNPLVDRQRPVHLVLFLGYEGDRA